MSEHIEDHTDPKTQQYMLEVQQFIKNIENTNISIEFDAHNDAEIQQCITDMETNIDEKSAEFIHNQTVMDKAQEIKAHFSEQILANAKIARQNTKNKLH